MELLIYSVGRQIGYAWNCKDHIDNLRSEVKTLKEVKGTLQLSVKKARKRGEKIETDVDEWLKVQISSLKELTNFSKLKME